MTIEYPDILDEGIQELEKEQECRGCGKFFASNKIAGHIKSARNSNSCKEKYDTEQLEKDCEERNKHLRRVRQARKALERSTESHKSEGCSSPKRLRESSEPLSIFKILVRTEDTFYAIRPKSANIESLKAALLAKAEYLKFPTHEINKIKKCLPNTDFPHELVDDADVSELVNDRNNKEKRFLAEFIGSDVYLTEESEVDRVPKIRQSADDAPNMLNQEPKAVSDPQNHQSPSDETPTISSTLSHPQHQSDPVSTGSQDFPSSKLVHPISIQFNSIPANSSIPSQTQSQNSVNFVNTDLQDQLNGFLSWTQVSGGPGVQNHHPTQVQQNPQQLPPDAPPQSQPSSHLGGPRPGNPGNPGASSQPSDTMSLMSNPGGNGPMHPMHPVPPQHEQQVYDATNFDYGHHSWMDQHSF